MLKSILTENSIFLEDEKIKELLEFEKLLLEYNERFNLTSIKESKEIYVKHFLDSLMGLKQFESGKRILEIGSGGGFPSVPLKIANRNLNFTLVEATGKKCTFLNVVKEKFKFDNFNVVNARCEDLAKKEEFREKYDYVTARAVAPMSSLMEYAVPFLKIGGKFVAYKTGNQDELHKAVSVGKILGATLLETIHYSLPEGERAFIIMKKVSKTDLKYPRGQGKVRSKPL